MEVLTMNEQMPLFFGQLGALCLALLYLYFFFRSYNKSEPNGLPWDTFVIGQVVDSQPKVQKQTVNPLHIECVEALVSIGFKKKEATIMTDNVFKNHSPDSLPDAISISMRYK